MDTAVLAQRVAQFALTHPDERDCWMKATALSGILAWGDPAGVEAVDGWLRRAIATQRSNGNLNYSDAVRAIGAGHVRSFTPTAALPASLGYPLLRRYQQNGDALYLEAARRQMDALRKIIKGGRLRVRRLYTFGSPISLLVLRASALVDKFRKGETLAPHNIGLLMGDNLSTPRWVNFWSRHDMASYPVDFLYSNEKGLIEDREIGTSINPKTAHTGYWTNSEMAEYISETF